MWPIQGGQKAEKVLLAGATKLKFPESGEDAFTASFSTVSHLFPKIF